MSTIFKVSIAKNLRNLRKRFFIKIVAIMSENIFRTTESSIIIKIGNNTDRMPVWLEKR